MQTERTVVPLQTIHEVKPHTFIYEKHQALDADFCRATIQRFENHVDEQYAGRVGQTVSSAQHIKKTTDLVVSGKEHWKDVDHALFQSLAVAIKEFRETFPYFKGPFKDMGYNLQRYQPGEFYHWHVDGGSHDFAMRQLVALWYLNDVPGPGGETEFLYQDVKVTPEAGKLVLFPPFWTHEHRAAVVNEGVKYIATTWVVFA